nr:DnaJ domain-containing protein [uncultured Albidiferax sp.]
MVTKKKTLYEILAVAADASEAEIQAAFDAASAKLVSQKNRISADDFDFKVKVIQLAFKTLSNPSSRDAYDAKLAAAAMPAPPVSAPVAAVPALALVPLQADAEALSLRAEAMALRADAMTMRADAMALRSGAAPFRESRSFASSSEPVAAGLAPLLRKILMVLGTLFAIAAVAQSVSLLLANRRAEMAATAAAQASEKVLLQEYYQTHGVRPANKAELDALEAENRRKENEKRTVEREKSKVEQDARRFEEESRRRGEQVANELRTAELQAKEQARRDDERREWQQKEDKRIKEQMERTRIEQQKNEWREVLRR